MPSAPSAPFLLWHEAVLRGGWGKLLRKRWTRERELALWMLQMYTLTPPALDRPTGREEALALAAATGWGR